MCRVIIADDQEVIREGLKQLIEQDDEIKVVGCAGNGKEAYELCGKLSPDIVLMDMIMPVCDGIECTRLVKDTYKSVKVVILTTFSDREKISQALYNGADGFVYKDIKITELRQLIKSTVKGLRVVHPNVVRTIMDSGEGGDAGSSSKEVTAGEKFNLTEREKSVISLIVLGKSNREIAAILFITEGRVKNVITRILDKLRCKDRTQLAIFAVVNNIIQIRD